MAAQQEGQAAPQQQRHPVFSKWGVTVYREDLDDLITAARAHPLAAVGVAAVAISIAILVLVLVGWLNLTPGVLTSVVLTVLGLPLAIFSLLALSVVLEMQIKTVLPILCILAIVYVVRSGPGAGHDDPATEPNSAAQQSVQQQQNWNVHDEYETIAQSVCTSMAIKENRPGWTFAVKRQCDSSTEPCEAICSATALHEQDGETKSKQWSCLGAIHVHQDPPRPVSGPSTVSKPSMGLKVYWSSSYHKGRNFCGPNYCCCLAAA